MPPKTMVGETLERDGSDIRGNTKVRERDKRGERGHEGYREWGGDPAL